MEDDLALNVHVGLPAPDGMVESDVTMVRDSYHYYHYGCQGLDDRGWGCGYRTLQTICSWVSMKQTNRGQTVPSVPTIPRIQEALVAMGDKEASFQGSREWIGSVEVGLTLDLLYDVPCKIVHLTSGSKLKDHIGLLTEHFQLSGAPVMMGGDADNASKGIFGVCHSQSDAYLLIVDPHYYGPVPTPDILQDQHMLLWRHVNSFQDDSFYNLCLPQWKE